MITYLLAISSLYLFRLVYCNSTEFVSCNAIPNLMPKTIHVMATVCDKSSAQKARQLFKSLLMFSNSQKAVGHVLHLFMDRSLRHGASNPVSAPHSSFEQDIHRDAAACGCRWRLKVYEFNTSVTAGSLSGCNAQSLLSLNQIHTGVDLILNLDVNYLAVHILHQVWEMFQKFTEDTVFGLALQSEGNNSMYTSASNTYKPYYQPTGVNAGVQLINMTRYKRLGLHSMLLGVAQKHKAEELSNGLQDVLNVHLSRNPRQVVVLPCQMNYRSESACSARPWIVAVSRDESGKSASFDDDLLKKQFLEPVSAAPLSKTARTHAQVVFGGWNQSLLELLTMVAEFDVPAPQLVDWWENNGFIAQAPEAVTRYVSAARSIPSPSPVFCEVGFNAGHSAAILLTAREEAILYEFDLFDRPYSRQSQQIFGHLYKNRFHITKGNSAETLPWFMQEFGDKVKCDLFSIDGDRSYVGCLADFVNAVHLMNVGSVMLINDLSTKYEGCLRAFNEVQQQGFLSEPVCEGTDQGRRWCSTSVLLSWDESLHSLVKNPHTPQDSSVIHLDEER
ncbi:hypothetical protein CEUSTIGMA_g5707.t1 [Chlamydomonas eustigma]|uniref:Methyltransferase FkbM domain-containing protein n=1 Tax=Chlamydomonas eustigma TaxID=1157962 RepID=A0A250X5B0_9CHLO|nr:hypothetical protein CEUSTIGMA_g5707.t1 [Chlamydomonas eustigma]|eukprot:GAX78265.1 hypothetical protein CEUSTIGMA_g5707.t1 [Chlamydomonas eustigma]